MGTPIPEPTPPPPVAPGVDCSICFGPGGLLGEETPSEITIQVTGVEKGPNWLPVDGEPPNGNYICGQPIPVQPCFFVSSEPGPNIGCVFFADRTGVLGLLPSAVKWFEGESPWACTTVVTSFLNDRFKNGTAVLVIPEVE